ncbi:hypothetical protein [Tumebacillus permanentifrigoris]|uniref:Condensation domain-containing protein n=1 Tax=Tumebacillus permanentifrigoris TaxID=378543 RepID=A0A316DBD6_9BACL|nr:hypothetical protein [Tumebacillus permanentifrigoris]PWK13936.1 hypothetical protein C7459_106216 [Tumebacillus permanentifrigoris]
MMWHKFVETVLRDDEARFNLEVRCANTDDLTAWLYATVQLIFGHDALLAQAWAESGAGKKALVEPVLEQLSMLRWLEPGRFFDRRVAIPLQEVNLAVFHSGWYYLIPVSASTTLQELDAYATSILAGPTEAGGGTVEAVLGQTPRRLQKSLREQLPAQTLEGLKALRSAPILLNWSLQASKQRLRDIRNGRRGGNDHPLVLFRTESSIVFDISHVMFDGVWAKRIVDVLTEVATQVERTAPVPATTPLKSLRLESGSNFPVPTRSSEVTAEATGIRLQAMQELRKRLAAQGIKVTVNDFLIWARFVHAREYKPSARALAVLEQAGEKWAAQICKSWEQERRKPPSLMILVDVFKRDPRLRLYPMTIQSDGREELAALSARLQQKIASARNGKSFATHAGQLLVWTPPFLRPLSVWASEQLRPFQSRIQADEVFSNLGSVGEHSSISRFTSARGRVQSQTRVWGMVTTREGVLYVTLRDFQPHVQHLSPKLAQTLTQDYLDAYTATVNRLIERFS